MTEPLTTDAKNRSWRTLLQGLVASVLLGIWPIVQAALNNGILSVDWSTLRLSAINAAATAGVSFLWRRFLDPSRIPSAAPPVPTKR